MCYISTDLNSMVKLRSDFWWMSSVKAQWLAAGTWGCLEHRSMISSNSGQGRKGFQTFEINSFQL